MSEFGMGYEFGGGQKKSDVPEEYSHDPDLYYAIQASLGQENTGVQNHDMIVDEKPKTSSTADANSELAKAYFNNDLNVSIDHKFDLDDDGGIPAVQQSAMNNESNN